MNLFRKLFNSFLIWVVESDDLKATLTQKSNAASWFQSIPVSFYTSESAAGAVNTTNEAKVSPAERGAEEVTPLVKKKGTKLTGGNCDCFAWEEN